MAITIDPAATDRARPGAGASVASWLGVLLAMLLTLNTVGGWVRLSGSGISIPEWPLIAGSLLPPTDAAGWAGARAEWERHQSALRAKVDAGLLSEANLGRSPASDAEFTRMFLTEYSHRLLAAITGLVLAGCLTVALRDRVLRRRVGWPLGGCAALVVLQAWIGGALVDQGTNTHWLFLHQGNSALIVACALWALLRLVSGPASATSSASAPRARPLLRGVLLATVIATWAQLVLGALVAGSKFSAPATSGVAGLLATPPLWASDRQLAWNLLDNAILHQWSHSVFAWALAGALALTYLAAARSPLGPRLRLALQVSATFIAVQMALGLASALVGGTGAGAMLPLAHQLMGMCLFVSLLLALFDSRHEPTSSVRHGDGDADTAVAVPARSRA